MKRLHLHVGVENLDQSIGFYSALFGADPIKVKTDYAKWLLDDPSINFAISTRADSQGLNHLGIQVDQESELASIRERFKQADIKTFEEGETVCCYARSDKSWVQDPAGIAWEAYQTMEDVQMFGETLNAEKVQQGSTQETNQQESCCVPSNKTTACCG